MSIIGNITEFDKAKESFDSYVERLENYMIANLVKKEQQVEVLLTAIGAETYGLLRNLATSAKPNSMKYAELVEKLKNHLNPKPSVIAERFNFHNRLRKDDESVADFAAQLKKLTINCEYGDFFDEALRDRLVVGLKKEQIHRKRLGERELDFNQAFQIAQSMEMAERQSADMRDTGPPGLSVSASIHQIDNKSTRSNTKASKELDRFCLRCGSKDHLANVCKFKKYKCNACGKVGHLSKVCRSNTANSEQEFQGTHHLDATEGDDDPLGMFAVRGSIADAVTVSVVVAGKKLNMEVDTGAAVTVIPKSVYLQQFNHISLSPCATQLKTYSGAVLPTMGEMLVDVEFEGQKATLPLVVSLANPQC